MSVRAVDYLAVVLADHCSSLRRDTSVASLSEDVMEVNDCFWPRAELDGQSAVGCEMEQAAHLWSYEARVSERSAERNNGTLMLETAHLF